MKLFLIPLLLVLASCGTEVGENIIQHNGHTFIMVKDTNLYGQGWVHDPECEMLDIQHLLYEAGIIKVLG